MMSVLDKNKDICDKLYESDDCCLFVIDGLPVYRSKDFPVYQPKSASAKFPYDMRCKLLSAKTSSKNHTKNNYARLQKSHYKHRPGMRQRMEVKGIKRNRAVNTDTVEKLIKPRRDKRNSYGRSSSIGYKVIGQRLKAAVYTQDVSKDKKIHRSKKLDRDSHSSYLKVTTEKKSQVYFEKLPKNLCRKRMNQEYYNSCYPLLIDTNYKGGFRTTFAKTLNQEIKSRKRIKKIKSQTDKCRCLRNFSSASIYTSLLDDTLYYKNDELPLSNDYNSEISIYDTKKHACMKRFSKITLMPQDFQSKLIRKRSIRTQVTVKHDIKKQRPKYQSVIQSKYKNFACKGIDTDMYTMESEEEIRSIDFSNSFAAKNLKSIKSWQELKLQDTPTLRKCRRLKHRHVTLVKTPMRPLMLSPHSATQLLRQKKKTFKVKQSKSAISTGKHLIVNNKNKESNFIRNIHDIQQSGDDQNFNKIKFMTKKNEIQKQPQNATRTHSCMPEVNNKQDVPPPSDDESYKLKHNNHQITSNSNTSVATNMTPLQAIKRYVKQLMGEVNQNKTRRNKHKFSQTSKAIDTTKNQVSNSSLNSYKKYRNAFVQHSGSIMIVRNVTKRKDKPIEKGIQLDENDIPSGTSNEYDYNKNGRFIDYNDGQPITKSNTSVASNMTALQAIKRYINQLRSENNQEKKHAKAKKLETQLDYSNKDTKCTCNENTPCICIVHHSTQGNILGDTYTCNVKTVTKGNQGKRKTFNPIDNILKKDLKYYDRHSNRYDKIKSSSSTTIATNTTPLQAIRRYISQLMLENNSNKIKTKFKKRSQVSKTTKTPHILIPECDIRMDTNDIDVFTQTGNTNMAIANQRQYNVRTIDICNQFKNQCNAPVGVLNKKQIYKKKPLPKCGFSLKCVKPIKKIVYELKPLQKYLTTKKSNLNNGNNILTIQNKCVSPIPIKLNRNNIHSHKNPHKNVNDGSEIIYPKILNSQCFSESIYSSESKSNIETDLSKQKHYFINNTRNFDTYFSKVAMRQWKNLNPYDNQDPNKQSSICNRCSCSLNSFKQSDVLKQDLHNMKTKSQSCIANKHYHCSLKCSDTMKKDRYDKLVQVKMGNSNKKCNCSLNSLKQLVLKNGQNCKKVKTKICNRRKRCNGSLNSSKLSDKLKKDGVAKTKSGNAIKQKRHRKGKHNLSTSSFGRGDEIVRSKHHIHDNSIPKKKFCEKKKDSPILKNQCVGEGPSNNLLDEIHGEYQYSYTYISKSSETCTTQAETCTTQNEATINKLSAKVTQYENGDYHEKNVQLSKIKADGSRQIQQKLSESQFRNQRKRPEKKKIVKNAADCKVTQCDVVNSKDSKSFSICIRCRRKSQSKPIIKFCERFEKLTTSIKKPIQFLMKSRNRGSRKPKLKNKFCEYPKLSKCKTLETFNRPSSCSTQSKRVRKTKTFGRDCIVYLNGGCKHITATCKRKSKRSFCKCPKYMTSFKIPQICNAPAVCGCQTCKCLNCKAKLHSPQIYNVPSICSCKTCKCLNCKAKRNIPQNYKAPVTCSCKTLCKCLKCKAKRNIPQICKRRSICSFKSSCCNCCKCKQKCRTPKKSKRGSICYCPKTFFVNRLLYRSVRYVNKGIKSLKMKRNSTTYFNTHANAWYQSSSVPWGSYVVDKNQKRTAINCYELAQRKREPYSFWKSLFQGLNTFRRHTNVITQGVSHFLCFILTMLIWCPFLMITKLLLCCFCW